MSYEADYEHALRDRDWAPFGGCSMNEHNAVSRQFAADFANALLAAIAEVPGLVPLDVTPENMHPYGRVPRAYWQDHPELAYYVSSVLEHDLHRRTHRSRAHLTAHYVPEEGPDSYPISEWLEPPLSFNVHAQADMLVGALKRHRREVLGS